MAPITFSGLASGIDSQALIEASSDAAREARVKPLEERISKLEDQDAALEELKTLMSDLEDLSQPLRALNGGAVSKTTTSTDETVASVDATNFANNSTFTLTVSQLAQVGTWSTGGGSTITSADAAIASGITDTGGDNSKIIFYVGTGTEQSTVTLSVTTTTTLNELATSFNSQTSKAIATVVNVGTSTSPSYKLMVQSLNEGTLKGSLTGPAAGPAIAVGSDITAAGVFTSNTLSQAQNAQFTITGISGTIERYTNSISDVITGLTLNLQKGGGVSTTITVGNDPDATTATMQEWADKFNELVAFVKENNLIAPESSDENAINVFGPLAGISIDNTALSALRTAIASSVYTSGSEIRIMADLGFKTKQDGTIEFDTKVFKTALSKEPTSVKSILETLGSKFGALTVDGGVSDQFTRFNGLLDTTVNSNKDLIKSLNESIARAEASILKQEEILRTRFARLESLVGELQSSQNALTSALAGLGG